MKILLAVDGSAYTKKMLAYLTTHLEVFSAKNEFTIFTVQMPLPARAKAAVGAEVANSYYAEEAEKVTAPVVKFLKRQGIEPKLAAARKNPGGDDAICRVETCQDLDAILHTAAGFHFHPRDLGGAVRSGDCAEHVAEAIAHHHGCLRHGECATGAQGKLTACKHAGFETVGGASEHLFLVVLMSALAGTLLLLFLRTRLGTLA